jgi:hypothetical protein
VSEDMIEKENSRNYIYQIYGRLFDLKSCEIFKILETVICISCVHETNVGNSGGVEIRLRPGELRNRGLIPNRSVASRPVLEPIKSPVQMATRAIPPEVKRPGCADDHSLLSSVEVKNEWNYTSTSHTSSWRNN